MMVISQATCMHTYTTKQQQVSYLVISEEQLLLSTLDIVHARHSSVLTGLVFVWKNRLQEKKKKCVKEERKCVY